MKRLTLIPVLLMCCSDVCPAAELRDPTRPPGLHTAVKVTADTFHLEAVVISDDTRWAIVNGTVVHRGDRIANAVIDDISGYSVRYSRNGRSEVASLPHSTLLVRRNEAPHEAAP